MDEIRRLSSAAAEIDEAVAKTKGLENYDDTGVKASLSVLESSVGYTRKNLLKNTAVSSAMNGVTFTVNADGSVLTSGTASSDTIFVLKEWVGFPHEMKNRELLVTGCPQGGSASGYRLVVHSKVSSGTSYSGLGADTGNGFVFGTSADFVRISVRIGANVNVNGLTFYPMLRYADITDDTYEPYKPSIDERIAALEAAINN